MVKKSRTIRIKINIYHHSFRYNMWKFYRWNNNIFYPHPFSTPRRIPSLPLPQPPLLHLVYKVYISLSRVWQPIDSLFVVRDNTNNTWKFVELIDKIIPTSQRDYLWQHGISYTWITWRCTGTLHDRVTEWAKVASRNSTTESGRTWTGPWSSGGSTPGTRNVGTGQGLWEGKYCCFFFYSSVQNTILFVECLLQWFFQLSQQRWKSVRWNKARLVASKTGKRLLPPIGHKRS